MINIAIDGPSGAGKSTLAKKLAEILGYSYLDTGAIYRTVGLFVKRNGVAPDDTDGIVSLLPRTHIDIKHENGVQHMYLGDEDVSGLIRTDEISAYASKVSAIPEVRAFLMDAQRSFAEKNNSIMDGRDIGTVVLPDATVKFFLSASDGERARRRMRELAEKGEMYTLEQVLASMAKRDSDDKNRNISPTVPAHDAHLLDNTGDFDETVRTALCIIRKTIQG